MQTETQKSICKESLLILEKLCLMDDDFFSEVLDRKIKPVEYIVNTILEREDVKIKSTKSQAEYKSATGRSIKLDIVAEDADGNIINIEIQRASKGSGEKRARFHSSMIDRTLLKKGEDYTKLVDTYVIFITEKDKFGKGIPLYHIDRRITEMDNALFDDGAHIIYVNGEYVDSSHPVGRLMHDFHCHNASEIYNPLLAEEVRYYKETEGGRGEVCKLIEEYGAKMAAEAEAKAAEAEAKAAEAEAKAAEVEAKAAEKVRSQAIRLLVRGRDTIEEIAEITELSVEEVEKIAKEIVK